VTGGVAHYQRSGNDMSGGRHVLEVAGQAATVSVNPVRWLVVCQGCSRELPTLVARGCMAYGALCVFGATARSC
jgi:hypothetical protein